MPKRVQVSKQTKRQQLQAINNLLCALSQSISMVGVLVHHLPGTGLAPLRLDLELYLSPFKTAMGSLLKQSRAFFKNNEQGNGAAAIESLRTARIEYEELADRIDAVFLARTDSTDEYDEFGAMASQIRCVQITEATDVDQCRRALLPVKQALDAIEELLTLT